MQACHQPFNLSEYYFFIDLTYKSTLLESKSFKYRAVDQINNLRERVIRDNEEAIQLIAYFA